MRTTTALEPAITAMTLPTSNSDRVRFLTESAYGVLSLTLHMASPLTKGYVFASDFDKTLTFNDTGYVLSELLGIATEEFERKIKGMALLNLVQQGAELSCLFLHNPQFRSKMRKEHLIEVSTLLLWIPHGGFALNDNPCTPTRTGLCTSAECSNQTSSGGSS